jgi:GNAT superfamily N-acetyltransferase
MRARIVDTPPSATGFDSLRALRGLLYKLRRIVREEGLGTAARSVPRRLWSRVSMRLDMLVLVKDLDEAKPLGPAAARLQLRPVERHDLPALAELNRERGVVSADARFAADIDAGYGGYVAIADGRVVGFYWWTDGRAAPPSRASIGAAIDELGLGIELEPGDVYGADLYVGERHRAGGTAQMLLDLVENDLRDRGYRRLWGYVHKSNRLGRWTYGLRGYQPMWRVVQVRTPFGRRSWTEPLEGTSR